jgi:hypothetical protein
MTSFYQLTIKVDFDPFDTIAQNNSATTLDYSGDITITIRAVNTTNKIYLHMDRNVILTPQPNPTIIVTNTATNQVINVTSWSYELYQMFSIVLAANLNANSSYTIQMSFTAKTTQEGFYYHAFPENFGFR